MSWPIAGATAASIGFDYWASKKAGKASDEAREVALANNQANIDMQREFAKNGIRWKVQDAMSAGIHPLYALGAQTQSFSPISVGLPEDNSKSDFLSKTGQNISRAIYATKTGEERIMNRLQIEGARLDNEYKQVLINNAKQTGPNFPGGSGNFIPSQGDSGNLMDVRPVKVNVSQPGRPAQEAGWRPDVSYSRTDSGLVPVIPEGLSESMEDDMIGKILWRIRNQFRQNFDSTSGKPPMGQLPAGYVDWHWSRAKQEWQPVKNKLRFDWRRGDFMPR